MEFLSATTIEEWLRKCGHVFSENKEELTQLDAAIGDADHGTNMARGFAAVATKLDTLQDKTIGSLFQATAMTLISKVGGASGPLYGTFFLQASRRTSGKLALTLSELCVGFDAGLGGIIGLGKAAVGDKTMIDALTPALAAMHPNGPEDTFHAALDRAVASARFGAENTIPLVARKGRASYLGERSVGHKDPGAASSALLLEALASVIPA